MPAKLQAKLPIDDAEARIEIIPLIDIMFFLLASFMLVSLTMVNLKSVKVNLPTATTATTETKKNFTDISIDKSGDIFLDKKPASDGELLRELVASRRRNPNLRVFISGDRDARHGEVIHALDLVRRAGIDKVAFEIGQSQKEIN
jgi:biopolymer transport protein ExbD